MSWDKMRWLFPLLILVELLTITVQTFFSYHTNLSSSRCYSILTVGWFKIPHISLVHCKEILVRRLSLEVEVNPPWEEFFANQKSHYFFWTWIISYIFHLYQNFSLNTTRSDYSFFCIKEMNSIFPLWTFHSYVATFQQHLHMEYIFLSSYDIPDLVVPIRISLLEGCC